MNDKKTASQKTVVGTDIRLPNSLVLNIEHFFYGMKIPNEFVEKVSGVPQDDKNFHLRQFSLGQYLEQKLDDSGMPCTVCIKDGELTILTHEEAAEYNPKRFRQHCNALRRSHYRTMKVDMNELSTAERKRQLERNIYEQSKILLSVEKIRAEVVLEAARRKAPAMLEHNG